MKHILFVCSQNLLRSPTAEDVFSSHPGVECASAGTNHDAENPLTPELIEWAEIIFVMEQHLANKRVICLDIPDEFEYMDEDLVKLLHAKVDRFLPAVRSDA